MQIKVKCYKENTRKNQIIRAVSIINGVQNYFFFELESDIDVDVCEDKVIEWNNFCRRHQPKDDEYIIYITEKPFSDNWFSHEESQYAIITANAWEEYFAPPSLKSYLIYQMAQAALNFECDLNEKMEMRMVHDSSKGCMFDFCKNKLDIKLGLIAGNICPRCKAILMSYGIDKKALYAVERMLTVVRAEAIGNPMIFDENAAFVVMEFSANDENANAYEYGVKLALKELNIKCVRADNELLSGQLLEKIARNIDESRFIIAKVDSCNLNVYFELGLAMGKQKDVLLISEKNLQLPTDLKNWECLTYERGNYEELKNKIIDYYKQNYHYKSNN